LFCVLGVVLQTILDIYVYTGESHYLEVHGTVAKFRVIRNSK